MAVDIENVKQLVSQLSLSEVTGSEMNIIAQLVSRLSLSEVTGSE